jgi:hypothetical protein
VSVPSSLPMPIDCRAAKIADISPTAAGGCVAAVVLVALLVDVVSWLWPRVADASHDVRDAAIHARAFYYTHLARFSLTF